MATPFSRTLRSLRGERPALPTVLVILLSFFLALWAAWFWRAEVPVFARSVEARLETRAAPRPIAAQLGGRVVEWRVEVGESVEAGALLGRLDSELEHRRLDEERARHAGHAAELEHLEGMLESALLAVDDDTAARRAAVDEAEARRRAAAAAAELAADELARQERLHAEQLISELEVRQARSRARQRAEELEAARRAVDQLERTLARERGDRRTASGQIEREIAELRGLVATSEAAIERLEEEIRQRRIVAPVGGIVAESMRSPVGAVVEAGEPLATILPAAELEVVALFDPAAAVARVRSGQRGQLRLDGFPWSEYGFLDVEVDRVSDETRDGRLRVHAAVTAPRNPRIPLQHGLPGQLEIEVERLSPAELIWRSAGRLLEPRPSEARPSEPRSSGDQAS